MWPRIDHYFYFYVCYLIFFMSVWTQIFVGVYERYDRWFEGETHNNEKERKLEIEREIENEGGRETGVGGE